ncbi:MAG: hypothetical protein OEV60_12985 [Actinomycetota bacterium]|nr:hypothetical protein [Actinomycetota bacterium]
MRRCAVVLVLLLLTALPVGVPFAAASSHRSADIETLDAKIARARDHVDRWFERIERWYERIERASRRVERYEAAGDREPGSVPVVRRTGTRVLLAADASAYAEAAGELRATLKDPRARHVQAELDAWNAYLAELVKARERASRPIEAASEGTASGSGLVPGQPLTYEGWAGAFLGRLGAPACSENLVIVVTWETAESTTAAFNPLATTRDMPAASDMNTVGVKHYRSLEQGLDASRDTLLLGAESYGYGAIVDALRGCAAAEVTARAINASAWCRGCVGGQYIIGLLPLVRSSFPEHAARLVSTAS